MNLTTNINFNLANMHIMSACELEEAPYAFYRDIFSNTKEEVSNAIQIMKTKKVGRIMVMRKILQELDFGTTIKWDVLELVLDELCYNEDCSDALLKKITSTTPPSLINIIVRFFRDEQPHISVLTQWLQNNLPLLTIETLVRHFYEPKRQCFMYGPHPCIIFLTLSRCRSEDILQFCMEYFGVEPPAQIPPCAMHTPVMQEYIQKIREVTIDVFNFNPDAAPWILKYIIPENYSQLGLGDLFCFVPTKIFHPWLVKTMVDFGFDMDVGGHQSFTCKIIAGYTNENFDWVFDFIRDRRESTRFRLHHEERGHVFYLDALEFAIIYHNQVAVRLFLHRSFRLAQTFEIEPKKGTTSSDKDKKDAINFIKSEIKKYLKKYSEIIREVACGFIDKCVEKTVDFCNEKKLVLPLELMFVIAREASDGADLFISDVHWFNVCLRGIDA